MLRVGITPSTSYYQIIIIFVRVRVLAIFVKQTNFAGIALEIAEKYCVLRLFFEFWLAYN